MRRLTSNELMTVYDDFLPKEAFDALLSHVTAAGFQIVHRERWGKVWRLGDGFPLEGARLSTYYGSGATPPEIDEGPRYPTGTPIDAFVDAVDRVIGREPCFANGAGATLNRLTVSPAVYRPGSGLSLHRDRFGYSGSYAYYIHREWNFHWGGHLLILDPRTEDSYAGDYDYSYNRPFLSDEDEGWGTAAPGLATCILPKPNRLVFIAPEARHMITRVDGNAGDRPRVALVGFFTLAEGPVCPG